MELTLDEISRRVDRLIADGTDKPTRQTLREHLNKLQSLLEDREDIYRVREWKDGMIYILDPLFLFYLRWGRDSG